MAFLEGPFTWDAKIRRFRDRDGQIVGKYDVRGFPESAVDQFKRAVQDRIRARFQRLVTESSTEDEEPPIDPTEGPFGPQTEDFYVDDLYSPLWGFYLGMEDEIRLSSMAAAQIGRGEADEIDEEDVAAVGGLVAEQLKHLDDFIGEVRIGAVRLGGAAEARAAMYAGTAVSGYEDTNRRQDIELFDEERRTINSEHPCIDCQIYQGQGWQPAGTLPLPTQACECRTNCLCTFEYRSVRE